MVVCACPIRSPDQWPVRCRHPSEWRRQCLPLVRD